MKINHTSRTTVVRLTRSESKKMRTISASASPSAIAASLKPPPEKGIAESHCIKISTSLVHPVRCTRHPEKRKLKYKKVVIFCIMSHAKFPAKLTKHSTCTLSTESD